MVSLLVTFASAHGYAVTNTANANSPAQYVTLSSFTETATIATGNYAFSTNGLLIRLYHEISMRCYNFGPGLISIKSK